MSSSIIARKVSLSCFRRVRQRVRPPCTSGCALFMHSVWLGGVGRCLDDRVIASRESRCGQTFRIVVLSYSHCVSPSTRSTNRVQRPEDVFFCFVREKVARDTDKLPRPHPLWSWTGSSHTSQRERMSKLDHSVTRSFDRSIHRIKHQPTAASACCFSNSSGCSDLAG